MSTYHGFYTFKFRVPPDIDPSTIEKVLVCGTFNGWRKNNILSRTANNLEWVAADVEIEIPKKCKYFLYKFYIHQEWKDSEIPISEDKWVIDYTQPIILHPEGKDCNILDVMKIAVDPKRPPLAPESWLPTRFHFSFRWDVEDAPKPVEDVHVVVLIDTAKDPVIVQLSCETDGQWVADTTLGLPSHNLGRRFPYWYVVDGVKRYNPAEYMDKDDAGDDCNLLVPEKLEHPNQTFPVLPPYHIPFNFSLSPNFKKTGVPSVYVTTSFDGWKNQHRLIPGAQGYHLDAYVACPINTKIYYYMLVDGQRDFYRSKPAVKQNGHYINFHICGKRFSATTRSAEPQVSIPPKVGRYTFCWPSGFSEIDIWVVGTFNNWTEDDSCKMTLSADGEAHTVTLDMPLRRTKYKYKFGKRRWKINPVARIEYEANSYINPVNYILPEDFYEIQPGGQTIGTVQTPSWSAPKDHGKSSSGFRLSRRALEAKGM